MHAVPDLVAIRHACQPIAAWWDDYRTSGEAEPHSLDEALEPARALGPVPGRIGEAIAYILSGCLANLQYSDVAAAFERVAAVGRGMPPEQAGTITILPPRPGPSVSPGQQLQLPGMP